MNLKLTDGSNYELPSDDKQAAAVIADIFINRGKVPTEDGAEVSWSTAVELMTSDATATPDIRPLLSSAMDIIIREPIEPLQVINGLFDRVQAKGLHTQVLAGAMGTVTAADIPERSTYPEVMFQIGGGMQTAWIGKSGLAAAFTEEALRYSTWDIWNMNLREMRKAMLRHKERKAVAFLKTLGTELFNNASPATSAFGVCTGRGLNMAANGSLTMDDLFKGMAHMNEEGFMPDILLMNPLYFYMGIQDPVLRNIFLAYGGGTYFQNWSGQAGPRDPWSNGAMGGMGVSPGNKLVPGGRAGASGIAGREHGMTSAPPIPQPYFPWAFRIVVSPFVPFDPVSQVGDIFLLSSGEVGYYLEDEGLTEVTWRDEHVDVVKVKLRERYGYGVKHEGMGVGVYKNVPLTRNYWDGGVHTTAAAPTSEVDSWTAIP